MIAKTKLNGFKEKEKTVPTELSLIKPVIGKGESK